MARRLRDYALVVLLAIAALLWTDRESEAQVKPTGPKGRGEPWRRRSVVRVWAPFLLTFAVLMFLASYLMLRDQLIDEGPSPSSGGLLVMLETEAFAPEVELDVSIQSSGYGVDWIWLEVTASAAIEPGTRWYVYASGQYEPPADAPLEMYCSSADRAVLQDGVVRCPADQGLGATSDVEYRAGEVLGQAVLGRVEGIVDYFSYDADSVTTITGLYAPEDGYDRRWVVVIPIAPIRLGRSGSERQGLLAPVGVGDFEWGSDGLIEKISPEPGATGFVSTSTGRTLNLVRPTKFALEADYLRGSRRVTYANPQTAEADSLRWDGRASRYQFSVVDADAQGRAALRFFLGGILASTGVGALFLLLEKALEACVERTRRANT